MKLTGQDNTTILVNWRNVALVESVDPGGPAIIGEDRVKITKITFANGKAIAVKETPEEIYEKTATTN